MQSAQKSHNAFQKWTVSPMKIKRTIDKVSAVATRSSRGLPDPTVDAREKPKLQKFVMRCSTTSGIPKIIASTSQTESVEIDRISSWPTAFGFPIQGLLPITANA